MNKDEFENKELKIKIGENIKAVRDALELTQEVFAAKVASSGRMIREYEKNKFPVSSEVIGLMVQEYKINPVFLFTGIGDKFLDAEVKQSCLEELKSRYNYNNENLDTLITELLGNPELVKDLLTILTLKKNNKDSILETVKIIENIFKN